MLMPTVNADAISLVKVDETSETQRKLFSLAVFYTSRRLLVPKQCVATAKEPLARREIWAAPTLITTTSRNTKRKEAENSPPITSSRGVNQQWHPRGFRRDCIHILLFTASSTQPHYGY